MARAWPRNSQDTGDLVARPDHAPSRRGPAARGHRETTARREPAAWRRFEQARHDPRDRFEPGLAARPVQARDRADQTLRVGMTRAGEKLADRSLLDDFSGIHP